MECDDARVGCRPVATNGLKPTSARATPQETSESEYDPFYESGVLALQEIGAELGQIKTEPEPPDCAGEDLCAVVYIAGWGMCTVQ